MEYNIIQVLSCPNFTEMDTYYFSEKKSVINDVFSDYLLFEKNIKMNQKFVNHLTVIGNNYDDRKIELFLRHLNYLKYFKILTPHSDQFDQSLFNYLFQTTPEAIILITPLQYVFLDEKLYDSMINSVIEVANNNEIAIVNLQKSRQFSNNTIANSNNFKVTENLCCFKAEVILNEIKKYSIETYEKMCYSLNSNSFSGMDAFYNTSENLLIKNIIRNSIRTRKVNVSLECVSVEKLNLS